MKKNTLEKLQDKSHSSIICSKIGIRKLLRHEAFLVTRWDNRNFILKEEGEIYGIKVYQKIEYKKSGEYLILK